MVYTNKFKIKSLFKNMISLKQRETKIFFTDIDKIKKNIKGVKTIKYISILIIYSFNY